MSRFLKFLDWTNKWMSVPMLGVSGLFGTLWEKDFSGYILSLYPERTGLHGILNEYIPFLFVLFFVAGGVCSSLRVFTQKSIGKLENDLIRERENNSLVAENIETLVTGLLLKLSEKIGFSKGDDSRLTIYIHNNNGHFISFGRYSPDFSYRSKGRTLLPDNQGCISHAWAKDWCYEPDLAYKTMRKRYAIPSREEYDERRMKSKFYAVKRIDTSNDKTPVAVIVCESLTPNRFTEAHIKSILDNEESYLAEIIGCLKDHIPDPQDATKRGF